MNSKASIYEEATVVQTAAAIAEEDRLSSLATANKRAPAIKNSGGASRLRIAMLALIGVLPSFLKRHFYRLFFGYRISKGVRIGLTILDARECVIEEGVSIRHLNVFTRIGTLLIKDHARIGHMN